MIKIYTDGSCIGNPGNGGWAAIIIENGKKTQIKGSKKETTNNAKIPGLRQFGVQELDMIPIVKHACKYATTLNDPNKVKYEFEKAVHIAKSGRPGPVWIQIPMDVQSSIIDETKLNGFEHDDVIPTASDAEVDKIIKLLKIFRKLLYNFNEA